MSLENEIKKLTTAVVDLTVAVTESRSVTFEQAPAAGERVNTSPKAESPAPKKDESPAPDAIDYSVVKAAALKLVQVSGRDALVAVLGEHDLSTASAAKPEQYPALLASLEKELKEAK